jgi:four helix bundle protein
MEPPSGQSGNRAIEQRSSDRFEFRKMLLWQRSQAFAESVAAVVITLPRDGAANIIGAQLVRAAGSIPANIAEGFGRFSQPAYKSHLSIARGSAFECESWLDLLVRRNYLSSSQASELLDLCGQVQGLLTTRMRGLGNAPQSYASRRYKGDPDA